MLDFRTDLADERKDLYKKANNIENEIDGIEATEEQINNNIKVTRVKIMNEQGERALGKVKGNYFKNNESVQKQRYYYNNYWACY